MKSRKLRVVIASIVVAAGVATAGFVAATTAAADPIGNGAVAQIATQPVNGARYCVIPTGELRRCGQTPALATRYTFHTTTCGSVVCYQIRLADSPSECLYYDIFNAGSITIHKIGYGSCASTSLRYRWRIEELTSFGRVQLRPASHPNRCVFYDPSSLPTTPPSDNRIVGSTSIAACASRPESHTWFRLLQR